MNCIFVCVFNQEKYVEMFYLLLESIFIYGNLDDNTDILIYTSTQFMNMIKRSQLFNDEKVKFEINDTYNDIDKACKSRLDLFNLSSITNYDKILYLDTDILVKDDINKVFDVCKEDILYVLEEGEIDNEADYWGKTLFGHEVNNYNDKSAFTSGILLFNHCEKMKFLFNKINEDIINRPYNFLCYDQPYIIYNAFKYNLYDNKILKSLVVNNDTNINSDKVIHHFPGGPGVYQNKIVAMTIFLNSIKDKTLAEKDIYIIQVGSHIGNTSNDYLYNNINTKFKYIMIEPVPYLFNQLKENYKSYNNITFLNIAISNFNGFIDLYIPSEKNNFTKLVSWASQLASTNKEHILTFVPECIVEKICVKCKSLNSLIKEYNIKEIVYLYTDTEGHDYDILMDLDLLLIRPKNIIFENKHMDGPKHTLDINNCQKYLNLLNHFKEYGYDIETQTGEDTHIKLFKTINIEQDIWTCSSKMREDIYDFFKDKSHFKIAEIGSHKGYSTKILSKIFSKVYAVDNSIEWTNFNKNFNKDATNIEYVMLDIYKDNWEILPDDIEVSFIDADHSYNGCKSDIFNSIKRFKNLKYIIFDDYGVWSGVKQIIDELIKNKTLKFEKFIGINDVPGPNGIVKNVNEGIICSVNEFRGCDTSYSVVKDPESSASAPDSINNNNLENKIYTWENSYITFLDNFKMDAFGEGYYEFIDKHNIVAKFGGRQHNIIFNDDYTRFTSTRVGDLQIVNGGLNN
jgi:FkbM family methyltransferase